MLLELGFNTYLQKNNQYTPFRIPYQNTQDNQPATKQQNVYGIGFLLVWIMAVYVAYECNKNGAYILHMVLAFFFPVIYLLQFAIRKYVIPKSEGGSDYCPTPYWSTLRVQ